MKLTFKIQQPTGRYRSFDHAYVDIKGDGKMVGQLIQSKNGYAVLLCVNVPQIGCGWKNITLKVRFDGQEQAAIAEAKDWLKAHWASISTRYPLHQLED